MITAAEHFEELFASDPDPWSYRSDFEEMRRHRLLLAMLDSPIYERTFEPACATGTLTALLAQRSKELVAWDGSANAIRHARTLLSELPNVHVESRTIPSSWPDGKFNLIVLSDFLYYLPANEITKVALAARSSVAPSGMILSCHWRGVAHDFLTPGGDAVHGVLTDTLGEANGPHYVDRRQTIAGWVL